MIVLCFQIVLSLLLLQQVLLQFPHAKPLFLLSLVFYWPSDRLTNVPPSFLIRQLPALTAPISSIYYTHAWCLLSTHTLALFCWSLFYTLFVEMCKWLYCLKLSWTHVSLAVFCISVLWTASLNLVQRPVEGSLSRSYSTQSSLHPQTRAHTHSFISIPTSNKELPHHILLLWNHKHTRLTAYTNAQPWCASKERWKHGKQEVGQWRKARV